MTLPDRLPRLAGRPGLFVRAVFWLVFAATLAGVGSGLWFNGRDRFGNIPTSVAFGFRTYLFDRHTIVGERDAGATGAGLADGDIIIAVGGTTLPEGANEYQVAALLKDAPTRTILSVRRDGKRVDTPIIRAPDVWSRPDPATGIPLRLIVPVGYLTLELYPLVLLTVSAILALRRPRDAEAILFATGFLALCWDSNVMIGLQAFLGVPNDVFVGLINLGWSLLLAAIAAFPNGRFGSWPARVAGAGALVMALTNLALRVSPDLASRYNQTWIGFATLVLAAAAVALVLRYRRSTPGEPERQQMKWVLLGFAVAFLLQMFQLAMKHVAGFADQGVWLFLADAILTPIIFVAVPIGLFVSLMRYRLYDAEAAISRSASYAMLTVALIAVFTGTEKVVELLGQEYLGNGAGTLAGGIGAAVMIAPLHQKIGEWAEHRFQKNLIRLRRGLPDLVGDLRETATLEDMGAAALARIDAEMRSTGAALIVEDRVLASLAVDVEAIAAWCRDWTPRAEPALDCAPDDPVFPMRVPLAADGVGAQGWLLLGPRPDGSLYGKDERAVLADIADPIARAIAVVRRREARERAAIADRRVLIDRIAAVETCLAEVMRGAAEPSAKARSRPR